jgi:hypothetical protein
MDRPSSRQFSSPNWSFELPSLSVPIEVSTRMALYIISRMLPFRSTVEYCAYPSATDEVQYQMLSPAASLDPSRPNDSYTLPTDAASGSFDTDGLLQQPHRKLHLSLRLGGSSEPLSSKAAGCRTKGRV